MHGESKHGNLRRSGDRPIAGDALQAVAEFSAHGVALCDTQGYCRYANLAFQRLTGYALHELRSRPLEELLHIHLIDSNGESASKRFTISRKDGNLLVVSGSFVPLEGEGNRVWLAQLQADIAEPAQRGYWMQLTQRLAAEAAGIGVWEWDLTSDVCTLCPVAAAILDLPPGCSMLAAQEWQSMVLPEDLPLLFQTRDRALRSGGHFKLEFRQRCVNDHIRWLSAGGVLQCDALGQPLRAIGVLQDVSERKRVEELDRVHLQEAFATAEADAKFRAFFYQSSYYAGVLALDGTLLEVNLASLSACGYTAREVIGRKFWLCAWWHRSRRMKEQVRRACMKAASGKVVRREMTYFLADGQERVSDMTLAPVTDEAGRVLYVAATGWDITERKLADAALRASEERYRLLSEMSPDAILVERQGKILYANSAAMRLFAASRSDQLADRALLGLVAPEHHAAIRKRRAQVLRAKNTAPLMELQLRRLDGKELEAQAVCGKVMWEGQAAIQFLLRDVSEIKKARAKLHQVSERLRLAIEGTGEGIWDWDIASDTIVVAGGAESTVWRGKH